LKSGLEVTPIANLCTLCTPLKFTDRDYLFAADCVGLSAFNSEQPTPQKPSYIR